MKKILTIFLALISVSFFSFAQSGDWIKVNCPVFNNLSSVTVSYDGRIFATSPNACHVSVDKGISWTSYNIPFASQYIDGAIWFSGKLYLVNEIGIISSCDGCNWILEKSGYGFPAICANGEYLFAFGHTDNSWRTDGKDWEQISQPSVVVSSTCAGPNILYAFCDAGGAGQTQSRVYQSPDNGQTWASIAYIPIQTQDAAPHADNYCAAGFNGDHTMQACGEYAYLYGPGDIRCVNYFHDLCLSGGKRQLTPSFYQGIIIENGDSSRACYFTGSVTKIVSNDAFAIAQILDCELYRLDYSPYLGLAAAESSNLKIYPNPGADFIRVNADKAAEAIVYNSYGLVVKTMHLCVGANTLDFSALSPGGYVVSAPGLDSCRFIKK